MHTPAAVTTRFDLADLIGRTPLVRLRSFEPGRGVEIYAKLESRNPGGSAKDRAALAMILDGERRGALRPGRVILDATSGNTGIAYAMIGASRDYEVCLCVPANASAERRRLMRASGAEVVLTDALEGSDGAIREARRRHAEDPGRYFYPDQYSNPANWRAHYEGTGEEILQQTGGRVTHFVAGLGTSGTFVGAGRRLRHELPSVRLVACQPDSPLHGLEGLKHMATAIVPPIYDPALADENIAVATETAYDLVRRLARDEGVFAGPSSGAALAGALSVAGSVDRAVIVVVFPDGGDRYLTESFWEGVVPDATGSDRAVRMNNAVLDGIRRHAVADYPDECCGVLLGSAAGRVTAAEPLANRSATDRSRRFLVSPEQYREAEARASAGGRELVGFYHSHPDHPAVPSAFDLAHAWPNLSYVIVSVRPGEATDVRSWRLRPDRSAFDEEPLIAGETPSWP